MKLIKKNNSQCLLNSFAMVLDIEPIVLLDEIGNSGIEPFWDDGHMRGHHIQELIDCCFRHGYSVTEIEPYPHFMHLGNLKEMITESTARDRLQYYLNDYSGVVIFHNHAVAWNHLEHLVYDPNGRTYPLNIDRIREFFIVTKHQS